MNCCWSLLYNYFSLKSAVIVSQQIATPVALVTVFLFTLEISWWLTHVFWESEFKIRTFNDLYFTPLLGKTHPFLRIVFELMISNNECANTFEIFIQRYDYTNFIHLCFKSIFSLNNLLSKAVLLICLHH